MKLQHKPPTLWPPGNARVAQFELRDTMVAGIVSARHATLATRNLFHFKDLSVPVVNPWLA